MTDDDERFAGPDPVSLDDALERVLRSLRGGGRRAEVGGVFGRWEEVVGADIAAHVRPVRLDRSTLLVEVDDPAWATQVRFLADRVCQRLAELTGAEVERLDVRVANRRGPTPS